MFSHLLHLVHLSNPDKLYDLHLKLILLSHDHLQNLETVHLNLLHPAERIKPPDVIRIYVLNRFIVMPTFTLRIACSLIHGSSICKVLSQSGRAI